MSPLPTHQRDAHQNVDIHAYGAAAGMSMENLQLMASIAESRNDWDSSGRWKAIIMEHQMDAAEVANRAQFEGTPLVKQAPAPDVPASPTTFDRSEPANRMVELPPVPPEAKTGDDREFQNEGHRSHPDAGIAAQVQRNQALLAVQERSMR